jgi:hypothetical protein
MESSKKLKLFNIAKNLSINANLSLLKGIDEQGIK